MLTISQLFMYPVKSLGGIAVTAAALTDRGFKYDRRWMLVDAQNRFLSQRELPAMALLQTRISENGILVEDKRNPGTTVCIPFSPVFTETIKVQVWEDVCDAVLVNDTLNAWFSAALDITCRLVYMPDTAVRKVDSRYAFANEITSFSDGYPVLMIGQASLDDLNARMNEPVPMDRFRPNIVFAGGEPFEEDNITEFIINDITFLGVKRCSRCVVTTIEQSSAQKGREPLRTLAAYRQVNNKIYFGQNILYKGTGVIHVGDELRIIKKQEI
jgi:uncharacterized protein